MSNVQSFVYSNGKRYLHRFVCGCVVPSFLLFFHLNCTNVIIIRCSCLCCWFSFSFLRSLGESCVWVLILACSQLVHSLRFIAISTILQNLLQFFFRGLVSSGEYICAWSYLSPSTYIHPSALSQKIALVSRVCYKVSRDDFYFVYLSLYLAMQKWRTRQTYTLVFFSCAARITAPWKYDNLLAGLVLQNSLS